MRTTWIMALMALAAAVVLALTACGENVRPASADTPEDSTKAIQFGAEGIGLLRTEHMFYGENWNFFTILDLPFGPALS